LDTETDAELDAGLDGELDAAVCGQMIVGGAE